VRSLNYIGKQTNILSDLVLLITVISQLSFIYLINWV